MHFGEGPPGDAVDVLLDLVQGDRAAHGGGDALRIHDEPVGRFDQRFDFGVLEQEVVRRAGIDGFIQELPALQVFDRLPESRRVLEDVADREDVHDPDVVLVAVGEDRLTGGLVEHAVGDHDDVQLAGRERRPQPRVGAVGQGGLAGPEETDLALPAEAFEHGKLLVDHVVEIGLLGRGDQRHVDLVDPQAAQAGLDGFGDVPGRHQDGPVVLVELRENDPGRDVEPVPRDSFKSPPEYRLGFQVARRRIEEVNAQVQDPVDEPVHLRFGERGIAGLSQPVIAAGSHAQRRNVQTGAAKGPVSNHSFSCGGRAR